MFEIQVITDVAAEPVTIEEIKDFCRIDADYSAEDSVLIDLCAAARELLEGQLNVFFAVKDVKVQFTFPRFELPYGPAGTITLLEKIVDDEDPETVTDYRVEGLQFKTIVIPSEYASGSWFYPINGGYPQWQGAEICSERFIITMSTGYEVLPAALKNALLTQIDYMYKGQGNIDMDVISPAALQRANRFSRNLPLQ